MSLNESMIILVEQGFEELAYAPVSFWIKLFAIFGIVFLFNVISKTGGNIIHLFIYVYAFFKWVIFKIRGKDI